MTGNKVTVENSTVGGFEYKNEAGEVIGVLGYIYGGYIASSEGEGNITENVVTLTKTTLKGATGVVGGWHSGKGTVTGNHVNLHQSEIDRKSTRLNFRSLKLIVLLLAVIRLV